jgi:hypothetical protein
MGNLLIEAQAGIISISQNAGGAAEKESLLAASGSDFYTAQPRKRLG